MANGLRAVSLLFLLAMSLAVLATPPSAHSAQTNQATGIINVRKSIESVSLDNRVSFVLTIVNNGTVPVFDLEIDEYMNSILQVDGSILITAPWGTSRVAVGTGGLASVTQVIVDPTPPNLLAPGQRLTLQYTQVAPGSGDFTVPTSLVWFSYKYAESTIRLSIYSNGQLLHVPNAVEKSIFVIYPYVLSAATFASTITILWWARGKLDKIKKSKL